jgi:Uma2 family endonuclease
MSIVTNFSDLDLTKTYTYSDYLKFRFQDRVEIIKGYILKMSPAPSSNHQIILQNLNFSLLNYFNDKPCRVFVAPFDVRLPIETKKNDITIVQPDLCIVCDLNKLDKKGCNGSPELIIEIVSRHNSKHDLSTKFKLYEEAKVKEYWIVNPNNNLILVYSLQENVFIGSRPYTTDDTVKSVLFPDLEIDMNSVFKNIL